MFQWLRHNQVLILEGKKLTPSMIQEEWKILEDRVLSEKLSPSASYRLDLFRFLADWFNDGEDMTVYTSGSTGAPKPIRVSKLHMMNSAAATCRYLKLEPGNTALLCMSLSYIAGKMMVVRALLAGLDLWPVVPSGFPLRGLYKKFDFAALVPMQIYNALQSETETRSLKTIGTLLIGGGALDTQLEKQLKRFPNKIYSTYGMTETLSHIALRRVSGRESTEWYSPMESVNLSQTPDGCLVVEAPAVCTEKLKTNDCVELRPDGRFRILGRKDNVINSGGIKIQTEELEDKLRSYLFDPFAISSIPDAKFGEIVVLVSEGQPDENLLMQQLHEVRFPAHEIPKRIFHLASLPLTESGKVKRAELKKLLNELL